jgi:2-C-methyl-D-erythritol 4-phosphate cytidylyltransferase/2-C-methyl-D-erythritol 2,4-cyclodiphosphate synthase
VLIHDAARPFATARQVATVLGSARRHGAAVSVLRASARDPVAVTSADRESLAEAVPNERAVWTRTPSAFRRDWLTAALAKADNEGRSESSTAALVLAAGFPVRAVDDAPDNVKITVPEDLALLKPSPAR